MIAIDNVLISDKIVEEQFVCDLLKCRGGCCEDGDAGAPLEKDELDRLNGVYEKVKPYLTPAGIRSIETNGRYQYDREFGWVTPTIEGKMCAYGYKDAHGVIKCGIEQAWNEGKTDWKKPVSCHLYPIKASRTKAGEVLNYEPRESLCHPACVQGKRLKVPAYVFLRDAIIRKYGQDFYGALEQIAEKHQQSHTRDRNRS
ncbi:MAG TPA: DUF3109 family protein [Puia sp.]|nr:DUF3109 family protein [Puia sp.]